MKKSILNLGRTLNKVEQKTINGGMHFTTCNYSEGGGGECGPTAECQSIWNGQNLGVCVSINPE